MVDSLTVPSFVYPISIPLSSLSLFLLKRSVPALSFFVAKYRDHVLTGVTTTIIILSAISPVKLARGRFSIKD